MSENEGHQAEHPEERARADGNAAFRAMLERRRNAKGDWKAFVESRSDSPETMQDYVAKHHARKSIPWGEFFRLHRAEPMKEAASQQAGEEGSVRIKTFTKMMRDSALNRSEEERLAIAERRKKQGEQQTKNHGITKIAIREQQQHIEAHRPMIR